MRTPIVPALNRSSALSAASALAWRHMARAFPVTPLRHLLGAPESSARPVWTRLLNAGNNTVGCSSRRSSGFEQWGKRLSSLSRAMLMSSWLATLAAIAVGNSRICSTVPIASKVKIHEER